jgi:hypothetical protein
MPIIIFVLKGSYKLIGVNLYYAVPFSLISRYSKIGLVLSYIDEGYRIKYW